MSDKREPFRLANRGNLEVVVGLLFVMGAMCPNCGHGTRVTSKRWSVCKKCCTRVQRRELKPADAAVTP